MTQVDPDHSTEARQEIDQSVTAELSGAETGPVNDNFDTQAAFDAAMLGISLAPEASPAPDQPQTDEAGEVTVEADPFPEPYEQAVDPVPAEEFASPYGRPRSRAAKIGVALLAVAGTVIGIGAYLASKSDGNTPRVTATSGTSATSSSPNATDTAASTPETSPPVTYFPPIEVPGVTKEPVLPVATDNTEVAEQLVHNLECALNYDSPECLALFVNDAEDASGNELTRDINALREDFRKYREQFLSFKVKLIVDNVDVVEASSDQTVLDITITRLNAGRNNIPDDSHTAVYRYRIFSYSRPGFPQPLRLVQALTLLSGDQDQSIN